MASTLQAIPQSDSDDSDFEGFGPSDIESDMSVDSVLSDVDSSGDLEVKVTEFVLSISFIPAHNYIIGSTVEYMIGVSNSIQYCHMSFFIFLLTVVDATYHICPLVVFFDYFHV